MDLLCLHLKFPENLEFDFLNNNEHRQSEQAINTIISPGDDLVLFLEPGIGQFDTIQCLHNNSVIKAASRQQPQAAASRTERQALPAV
jgi:single-stranded DNA-specific DHH superfamily exonuclease